LEKVKQIACGAAYTMTLTQSGEIYTWGLNEFQQLGFADEINRNIPERLLFLPEEEKIKQIICGNSHSIALTYSNEIYSWGFNYFGQLGLGQNISQSTPQKLGFPFQGEKVKEIVGGKSHTIALTHLNEVYVWGNNSKGQLGLDHNIRQYTPCKLNFPDSVGIKQVMCTGDYSMAITYLNEVYVWEDNQYGQLGLGDNVNRNVPTKLPSF
jgi:alpha-tubulin suppressor-like RCC1 family protein